MPVPGSMVHLSVPFTPAILKGIKVHADNPFRLDFILDKGDFSPTRNGQIELREESTKLIKYFLASLTIPEKDFWVNLSPYEGSRIIPQAFGLTEMGRDLLAQDYLLKQITATLIYPEETVGRRFWKRIYEEAARKYGKTDMPVNTFNKVWILPEKAVVYENGKLGAAYVVESRLKVMLEQDYYSLEKHSYGQADAGLKGGGHLGSQILREVVLPELNKEVNENKNFVKLRQVYNSLILATWYKKKIKDSILMRVYSGKSKVAGINIDDPREKEKIYQRYVKAFKKGVYNYIKEDKNNVYADSNVEHKSVVRKYFSGGVDHTHLDAAMVQYETSAVPNPVFMKMDGMMQLTVNLAKASYPRISSSNQAMISLEGLKDIKFADINVDDKQKSLGALVVKKIGVPKRTGVEKQEVGAYIERMLKGERLVDVPPDPVDTFMGEIDLNRINNIKLYDKRTIIADLLRDLWVADQLGLISVNLAPNFGFGTISKALKKAGLVNKSSLKPTVRFDDYWAIRNQVVTQAIVRKDIYSGNKGQIRFVQEMRDQGKIRSTNLSLIYEIFDEEWVEILGWTNIAMPLEEAKKVRELVEKVIQDQKQIDSYTGNAGQIKFVQQMKAEGKIQSTNLGQVYSALEEKWIKVLGWKKITMPLEEAKKVRVLVGGLIQDQERMGEYKGNAGQVKFMQELRDKHGMQSTHLGNIYDVLDGQWIGALEWKRLGMPLDEVKNFRKLVGELMQDPVRMESYKGKEGLIKFVREMKSENQVKSTGLAAIYSVLDQGWIEVLGWKFMNMSLEEAEKVRRLVIKLVQDQSRREQYKGNAGQIRFVRQMSQEGVESTNLSQVHTVLDDEWVEVLEWEVMDMPLKEAENLRKLVGELIQDVGRIEQYQGNAGQVQFVQQMKDEGRIKSTHLGHAYSVLEEEWLRILKWKKMDLPLEEAKKMRELVEGFLKDQEQVEEYEGNAGQIRFVQEMKKEQQIKSTHLGHIYTVLDETSVKALRWKKMDMPLDEAVNMRGLVEGLVQDPGRTAQYKGKVGQVKFVQQMKKEGKIKSTHLGHIYSVLEEEWIKLLEWTVLNMPLNEAVKMMEDRAMTAGVGKPRELLKEVGGVDLSNTNKNLNTESPNGKIEFYIDPAMLREWQDAPGFVPVIVDIQPVPNMYEFFGINAPKTMMGAVSYQNFS